MLNLILSKVTEACHTSIEEDERFKYFQEKFYNIIKEYPREDLFTLDEAFNACVAQAQKIAYLQGLRDFAKFHVELKGDVTNIINGVDK